MFTALGRISMMCCAVLALAACGGSGSSLVSGPPVPGPSVPSAPTAVIATAGNTLARVTFDASTDAGGSPISGYTVRSSPVGGVDKNAGSSELSHLVTGLTNGVRYTFTVTASNATGASSASSASNEVSPRPPTPAAWRVTGSLQQARTSHTATLLANGKVLVVGGTSVPDANHFEFIYLSSAELYDPATKAWKTVAAMDTGRTGHTATLLPNGKVMIVGGNNSAGYVYWAELYDPATDTWTLGAPLAGARAGHRATLLSNGKVLVIGGENRQGGLTGVELYDPGINAWTTVTEIPFGPSILGYTATLLPSGKLMITGGAMTTSANFGEGYLLYDPLGNAWTRQTTQPRPSRDPSTASLLSSGKLLFTYWFNYSGASLFDPETNLFTAAGGDDTAAGGSKHTAKHTATVLSNGTVLLVGGVTAVEHFNELVLATAELYDPATNTWSQTAPLIIGPRYGHTATRLPNGAVLVVGGISARQGASIFPHKDAALYEFL